MGRYIRQLGEGKRVEMDVVGGIDIGGTKIAVAAVTTRGEILDRCECATTPSSDFADAEDRVAAMLERVLPANSTLLGIGIACPGPVDSVTGAFGEVGTLPHWTGQSFVPGLQQRFGVEVAVENDADAAALAEAHWGTDAARGSFLYITVSTGIGGGLLLSGDLYRGAGGAHPEMGHQIIQTDGPMCYCGSRGCWESLASGSAMVQWMQEQRPTQPCSSAFEVCRMARAGDEISQQAVQRESYYLGLGLANLVTLLSPDVISLGGGVMKSSDLFFAAALNVVSTKCTQVPMQNTRIVLASLGPDVALLGAARAWMIREDNLKGNS